jgi:hypothetical protein
VTAKGNYEVFSLSVGADSEEAYKAAFLDICKEIKKGEFLPMRGQVVYSDVKELEVDCRYCNYGSVCKHIVMDAE